MSEARRRWPWTIAASAVAVAALAVDPVLAFQAGTPGGAGPSIAAPLDLLAPGFIAPLPRGQERRVVPMTNQGGAPPPLAAPNVTIVAPLPPPRPAALARAVEPTPVAAAPTLSAQNPAAPPPAVITQANAPAAQLASLTTTPVSLPQTPGAAVVTRGTATTMVVPSGPGAAPTIVVPGVRDTTPSARGPALAALPDPSRRDWPRFVPGTPGGERNTGHAGERVLPDPGVRLSCLPAPVRRALNDVASRFGPILVRSTMRGNGRFQRSDPWRGSYHRDCRAADFRIAGGGGAGVMAFLRSRPDLGGVKRYRNGLIHIDDGPRRSW